MSLKKSLLKPPKIASLRQWIQEQLPELQQAPILVLSSEPAAGEGLPITSVRNASKLVQFTLSQQFGLRTVPATISSAFPTVQELDSRYELLRRTGASSIVAVGSGAAMDLAKALASEKENSIEQIVLVPSTYAATMASGASHSLLLDSIEETLVPSAHPAACPRLVAPLEEKYIASMEKNHVLYATLSLVLDASLRKSDDPVLNDLASDLTRLCVEAPDQDVSHETLIDLCYRSGSLISFGLGREDRSAPMALASALIPAVFPHVHMLTFFANLVPGLCYAIEETSTSGPMRDLVKGVLEKGKWATVPRLTVTDESLKGFSVPDMALSHIQANSAASKAFDLPNKLLTDILQQSIGKLEVGEERK